MEKQFVISEHRRRFTITKGQRMGGIQRDFKNRTTDAVRITGRSDAIVGNGCGIRLGGLSCSAIILLLSTQRAPFFQVISTPPLCTHDLSLSAVSILILYQPEPITMVVYRLKSADSTRLTSSKETGMPNRSLSKCQISPTS